MVIETSTKARERRFLAPVYLNGTSMKVEFLSQFFYVDTYDSKEHLKCIIKSLSHGSVGESDVDPPW